MLSRSSLLLLSLSASYLTGLAAPQTGTPDVNAVCPGGNSAVVSEAWIGKDKNVLSQTLSCPDSTPVNVPEVRGLDLDARQTAPGNATNVCGTNCATNCFSPAGGGPDPNECNVIADALRYEGENVGAIFAIGTSPNNTITMQYRSCLTFFRNQDLGPLAYCRTDWASLVDWLAFNCQATQNAHGGNCVANDQRWFVQVQHPPM